MRIRALVAAGVVLLVAGCSSGPQLSRDDAVDWAWPLTVDGGAMVCEDGISGAAIGFRPDGADKAFALTEDAVADAGVVEDSDFVVGIASVWDGSTPIRPFFDAAWQACDWDYASDRDVAFAMGEM